jgi:tetratricopeptide (TPR) repeat protein
LRQFKIKPSILTSIIIVLSGIGSLPLDCPKWISIVLLTTGTIGTVWSYFRSENAYESLQSLVDIQAEFLSANKSGNTYLEKLKKDLEVKGRTINYHEFIKKALQIDPDNPDVIHFYSQQSALWLSHCQRFEFLPEIYIISESNRLVALVKKTLKKNPKYFALREVLGILYDIKGLHDDARDQFYKISKYRKDPYWLFLVATSWIMENRSDKALECMETAISKGAIGWIVNYNYGGALQKNGKYLEAYKYLKKAFRFRDLRAEVVDELVNNLTMRCKYFSASMYSFILSLIKSKQSVKQAFISFGGTIFLLSMGSISAILRFVIICANVLILPKIITRKISFICEPQLSTTKILLQKGHFEQAENIASQVSQFNNIKILNVLALSQARQGKLDKAILTIDKALHIYRNDEILLHNQKSFIYVRDGGKPGRLVNIDRLGQLHVVKKILIDKKRYNRRIKMTG